MFGFKARKRMESPRRPFAGAGPGNEVPFCEPLEQRVLLSLLGIGEEIGNPELQYDRNGTVAYDAAMETFDVDAMPTAIALEPLLPGQRPTRILDPSDFQLHIKVDSEGNLIGGVEGDDLAIWGQFDADGDRVIDYSGLLLTGEIAQFGYLDNPTSDQYEFRLTPTGGALLAFFEGYDIGIDMLSLGSTFADSFAEDFSGGAQGTLGVIAKLSPPAPASLAGRVFYDSDNDGSDAGEAGIAGVTVELAGTDVDGNAVALSTVTGEDGGYVFEDVAPGTYTVSEVQPDLYLDGMDSAGSTNGTAGPVGTDAVVGITLASGDQAVGVNFGEIIGCDLFGFVWEDFNDDGEINFGEQAIAGVTVTLEGTNDLGEQVLLTDVTQTQGDYYFTNVRPGTYTITETQPDGFEDGQESLGTVDGVPTGLAGNDQFTGITVGVGQDAENYNFGELPQAGSEIVAGQTATIGFWQNKNGQRLLDSLNGGAGATQLGSWLATTFPNLFGAPSPQDLAGMTNAEVADYYRLVFKAKRSKKLTAKKLEAQIMAVALASYVTNSTLAGTTAEAYGFLVTEHGLGVATFNIGDNGAAFGVADNTEMTVMEILAATNDQSIDGVLFQMNNVWRSMANDVYTSINESGDI